MKKVLISLVLLALPALASAQNFCPPFVPTWDGTANLTCNWNACIGTGAAATNRTFACTGTANTTARLNFQFKVARPMNNASAETAIIDVVTTAGTLPAFYNYDPSAGCAGSGSIKGISVNFFPPNAADSCAFDQGLAVPFGDDGNGASDFALTGSNFGADSPASGRGRFLVSGVRAHGAVLDPAVNYWAFQFLVNNRLKTACVGCINAASFVFQSIGIESYDPLEAAQCLTGADRNKVGGTITAGADFVTVGGPGSGPTAVQKTTWGQIKALYR